jgi:hypothetical protein
MQQAELYLAFYRYVIYKTPYHKTLCLISWSYYLYNIVCALILEYHNVHQMHLYKLNIFMLITTSIMAITNIWSKYIKTYNIFKIVYFNMISSTLIIIYMLTFVLFYADDHIKNTYVYWNLMTFTMANIHFLGMMALEILAIKLT